MAQILKYRGGGMAPNSAASRLAKMMQSYRNGGYVYAQNGDEVADENEPKSWDTKRSQRLRAEDPAAYPGRRYYKLREKAQEEAMESRDPYTSVSRQLLSQRAESDPYGREAFVYDPETMTTYKTSYGGHEAVGTDEFGQYATRVTPAYKEMNIDGGPARGLMKYRGYGEDDTTITDEGFGIPVIGNNPETMEAYTKLDEGLQQVDPQTRGLFQSLVKGAEAGEVDRKDLERLFESTLKLERSQPELAKQLLEFMINPYAENQPIRNIGGTPFPGTDTFVTPAGRRSAPVRVETDQVENLLRTLEDRPSTAPQRRAPMTFGN
jgi:hypothetical protein